MFHSLEHTRCLPQHRVLPAGPGAGSGPLGRLPATCFPEESGFLPSPIPRGNVSAPLAVLPENALLLLRAAPLRPAGSSTRSAPRRRPLPSTPPLVSRRPLPREASRSRACTRHRGGGRGGEGRGGSPGGRGAPAAPARGESSPAGLPTRQRPSAAPVGAGRGERKRRPRQSLPQGPAPGAKPDRAGQGRDGTGRAGKASPGQGVPAQPHPAPTAPHLSPGPGPGQSPPEAKPGASPSPTLQTCSGPSWGGLAEVALP